MLLDIYIIIYMFLDQYIIYILRPIYRQVYILRQVYTFSNTFNTCLTYILSNIFIYANSILHICLSFIPISLYTLISLLYVLKVLLLHPLNFAYFAGKTTAKIRLDMFLALLAFLYRIFWQFALSVNSRIFCVLKAFWCKMKSGIWLKMSIFGGQTF